MLTDKLPNKNYLDIGVHQAAVGICRCIYKLLRFTIISVHTPSATNWSVLPHYSKSNASSTKMFTKIIILLLKKLSIVKVTLIILFVYI